MKLPLSLPLLLPVGNSIRWRGGCTASRKDKASGPMSSVASD